MNIKIKKGYDFNTNGNLEGWTGTANISGLSTANGELAARIVKNDPFVYTPDNLGIKIDSEVPTILKFRLRQTTGTGQVRIYFVTDESPSWGESQAFYISGYDYKNPENANNR